MHSNPDALATGLGIGFVVVYLLFVFGALAFMLVMNWKIASKAGYSGALSLLMLIPLVNLVIIALFAFSKWPIQQQLEQLQAGGAARSIPPMGRASGM